MTGQIRGNVVGLEDVMVIATDDATLATDHAQDVKHIVDHLKAERRDEHALHKTVHRPWGSYRGSRFQVKRITAKPGERLSLQMHQHRAEHWIVVEGTTLVRRGEEEIFVSGNQSVYIPMGTTHRLENSGKVPLHLIEVQSRAYLGEDEIIRLDDGYWSRLDTSIVI
ncbi:cupin domain-containing protein [Azospirillum sp. TSH64]|uniref:cupin domain-containing protein n=1 Tax=Azospirillum sp. TSH64 TaxID=652740 RepID=UPI000D614389|nr:hypothetical protein TSH64_28370 [Azospirillum sp. TSH64]PWC81569.1 hypothetical protein TSH64_00165 [Azospirillum sp. TSH64]